MQHSSEPLDPRNLTRIGGQKGSNPAGIFQDTHGNQYYIKTLESPMHARNEWLAAMIYKVAGAPTLHYVPCKNPCSIATYWQPLDKKHCVHFDTHERKQAQQWLGVHAWTANWDAAGFDGDNQGTFGGKVITLDVGGALNFRAHGDPKGKAFGTRVGELITLRNDKHNPHALRLFSDIGSQELLAAIRTVTQLSDDDISSTILTNRGSQKLVDKMLARKQDMADFAEEFCLNL